MKKRWYYLAATLLMAGCAEDAFEDGSNVLETEARQEIKLFAGTKGIEVDSRGAGTVGGLATDATNNVWNGQELIIWGIKNNATDLTKDNASNVYLTGVKAIAPTDVKTGAIALDGGPLYYPLQGAFNFTGYYIDDAAGTTQPERTATTISQAVTIDGSQDIMIAKAGLTATQKIVLVDALIEYEKLTGVSTEYVNANGDCLSTISDDKKKLIEQEYQKAFSSYTARRLVQPEMTFEHQLARLEFSVIAGDPNAQGSETKVNVDGTEYTKGILIEEIKITDAQNKGTITIDNAGEITFTADANAKGELILKSSEKNTDGSLKDLEETAPAGLYNKDGLVDENSKKNVYTKIGESILAFPASQYIVDIKTIQYIQAKKDGTGNEIVKESGAQAAGKETSYTNVTIKLSGTDTFEAGKTYDIKVKVYSNQEIVITATLQGWEEGEEVKISPEDDLFDQEFNSSTGTTNP